MQARFLTRLFRMAMLPVFFGPLAPKSVFVAPAARTAEASAAVHAYPDLLRYMWDESYARRAVRKGFANPIPRTVEHREKILFADSLAAFDLLKKKLEGEGWRFEAAASGEGREWEFRKAAMDRAVALLGTMESATRDNDIPERNLNVDLVSGTQNVADQPWRIDLSWCAAGATGVALEHAANSVFKLRFAARGTGVRYVVGWTMLLQDLAARRGSTLTLIRKFAAEDVIPKLADLVVSADGSHIALHYGQFVRGAGKNREILNVSLDFNTGPPALEQMRKGYGGVYLSVLPPGSLKSTIDSYAVMQAAILVAQTRLTSNLRPSARKIKGHRPVKTIQTRKTLRAATP